MRVNEIFYSLQGEGAHAGVAAVFVRLAGCNLKCPFCDTEHNVYNEMSIEEIVFKVSEYPAKWVILTGGEPTIQNITPLVRSLKNAGKCVAIESNGTHALECGFDWITISPKVPFVKCELHQFDADELKLVFNESGIVNDFGIRAKNYYLQPCDTGDEEKNIKIINECINYIKKNPKWKLSLQIQKILKIR